MDSAYAVVDAQADGATLWASSQKPHFALDGIARVLDLPPRARPGHPPRGAWLGP